MNSPFRFKQFQVYDHQSSMKVGTDSVLLGSWAQPPKTGCILDVGTGCGILALMMAQKSEARISAIDIHEPSIRQAVENFSQSPWPNRLIAVNSSIEQFAETHPGTFDFIISNPPFFINSLKPSQPNKLAAKHSGAGFPELFIPAISVLLKPSGRAAWILPPQLLQTCRQVTGKYKLGINRIAYVHYNEKKKGTRVMIEAKKCLQPAVIEENIFIKGLDNKYTNEYLALTGAFYAFLKI